MCGLRKSRAWVTTAASTEAKGSVGRQYVRRVKSKVGPRYESVNNLSANAQCKRYEKTSVSPDNKIVCDVLLIIDRP